jgi:hypothetical protein
VNLRLVAAKHVNNISTSSPSEAPTTANDVVMYYGETRRRAAFARHADVVRQIVDDDKKTASVLQATTTD